MIYQGTSVNTTGTGTQIGTSAFNTSNVDNMYVGYMYTDNQVHGLGSSSTIKGVLDQWYSVTSGLTAYADYIDGNAGFCGDRTPYSGSGTGRNATYYATYNRLVNSNNPSLQCSDSGDIYTTSGSSTGNKSLTYPIGLLTADEAVLTGITYNTANTGSYLYTGQNYWTMSPSNYNGNGANVFRVDSSGSLGDGYYVSWIDRGVRPVINIRSDVALSGSGTTSDPFVVVS